MEIPTRGFVFGFYGAIIALLTATPMPLKKDIVQLQLIYYNNSHTGPMARRFHGPVYF